jgi:hypothetical protein
VILFFLMVSSHADQVLAKLCPRALLLHLLGR